MIILGVQKKLKERYGRTHGTGLVSYESAEKAEQGFKDVDEKRKISAEKLKKLK
jgi:hypothetical protein